MTLIRLNTIQRPTLLNEIDNWFNSFASDMPALFNDKQVWRPHFEVLNTSKAYSIRADLPGMVKKDVNIEIVDNALTISGDRKNNNKESNRSNYSEISYGKFSRTFQLPDDAMESKIHASMKDGVLSLQIPRVKPIAPEIKKIDIK